MEVSTQEPVVKATGVLEHKGQVYKYCPVCGKYILQSIAIVNGLKIPHYNHLNIPHSDLDLEAFVYFIQ